MIFSVVTFFFFVTDYPGDRMHSACPVYTHEISGVNLALYTADEIRKLSVLEVTNTVTMDAFNAPVPNGLYDLAFGPSSREEYAHNSF